MGQIVFLYFLQKKGWLGVQLVPNELSVSEFKELLETTKLPVAHLSFPEEEAPMLPFICLLNPEDNNFAADGVVYFSSHKMIVEAGTGIKYSTIQPGWCCFANPRCR